MRQRIFAGLLDAHLELVVRVHDPVAAQHLAQVLRHVLDVVRLAEGQRVVLVRQLRLGRGELVHLRAQNCERGVSAAARWRRGRRRRGAVKKRGAAAADLELDALARAVLARRDAGEVEGPPARRRAATPRARDAASRERRVCASRRAPVASASLARVGPPGAVLRSRGAAAAPKARGRRSRRARVWKRRASSRRGGSACQASTRWAPHCAAQLGGGARNRPARAAAAPPAGRSCAGLH